jgi:sugar phosphate isomerase/epimerase
MILGHFCLEGLPRERFRAAAAAGFTGVSLFWQEVAARRQREGGLAGCRRELLEAGIGAPVMEYIPLPTREELPGFAAHVADVASASADLGCAIVQAVALGLGTPFEVLVEGLRELAQACANARLKCVVEFVPFITSLPNLRSAVELVHAVDQSDVGLLIDSMHFLRSGAPWDELNALDVEVMVAQVNDAPLRRPNDDYGLECMTMRRLPGDGAFDLTRFIRTLNRISPGALLMAEVVNSELLAMPAVRAAAVIAEKTRWLGRTIDASRA